jgi:hypothetical protein
MYTHAKHGDCAHQWHEFERRQIVGFLSVNVKASDINCLSTIDSLRNKSKRRQLPIILYVVILTKMR